MKTKPFILRDWLLNTDQKVVNQEGKQVFIQSVDFTTDSDPIEVCVQDGTPELWLNEDDLFVVVDENEDSAKSIEQAPLEWKKLDLPKGTGCVDISNLGSCDYIRRNGLYISIEDLDKLKKPDTVPEEFKKSLELIIKEAREREDWEVNLDADSELLYGLAKKLLLEKELDIQAYDPSGLLRLIKQKSPLEFVSMIGPDIKSAQIDGKEKALEQMPKWKADADFSSGQSVHNGRLYSYGLSISIEELLSKLPKPDNY